MFVFPRDLKAKLEWKTLCKIERHISSTTYVCQLHFEYSKLYSTRKFHTKYVSLLLIVLRALLLIRQFFSKTVNSRSQRCNTYCFAPVPVAMKSGEVPKRKCIVKGCDSSAELEG